MLRTAAALILVTGTLACGVKPPKVPDAPGAPNVPGVDGRDENSGGDHVRGKAKEIVVGETFDDHVSDPDGDHTDWKKFSLIEPTNLTLLAFWDDPSVETTLTFRDQFGGQLYQVKHARGERQNRWAGLKLREGEYYLEVVATRGASVYTLHLIAQGGASFEAPGGVDVDRPE